MLKANCIYHTDDNMDYIGGHKFSRRHIVAFSLDENVFTDFLPCDSRLDWPPPTVFGLDPRVNGLADEFGQALV
jgi:hypothetical protein